MQLEGREWVVSNTHTSSNLNLSWLTADGDRRQRKSMSAEAILAYSFAHPLIQISESLHSSSFYILHPVSWGKRNVRHAQIERMQMQVQN